MKYYNRNTKEIMDIKEQKSLIFLYKTITGRLILKIITKPLFSKPSEKITNSKISKLYIKKFIKKNNIDMTLYQDEKYKSFQDFFTRKVKNQTPNKDINKKKLISPCTSKLMIYKIDKELTINVKNTKYSVENLIKQKDKTLEGGLCLVFRLSVDDYHRYHAFDNQKVINTKKIKGKLHTVNPISYERYKVFTENQREVTKLKTENFGIVYQIEVGALNVGKIHNTNKKSLKKYEEKGYFTFGGSTIILLFQKDKITIDKDILFASKQNMETKINYGDIIGKSQEKRKN